MAGTDSETRFEGAGQEFHAKYMGCVEVAKSKGQEVCQEAMQKLLVTLKTRKEPKPRLIINLSFEGTHLKEMPPGINLLEMTFKHSQVSYVWKDPRDQRSVGIVSSEVDPGDSTKVLHKFHGIRTVKPAMPFLQEMQELFRIVKERTALYKERAASVAAADEATTAVPAAPHATEQQQQQQQQQQPADPRDRAVSNLLGPDSTDDVPYLPKNASMASLDDLGDIFSASTTIGQQPVNVPTSQPMGGGPFGQPMGGGQFGQPMGGSQFGQPMGGGQFGQPMGGSQFGQLMGGSPYGQPASTNPFGQPMGGNPYGQPMGSNPYGQPMGGNPYGQPMGSNPYGQPMGSNPYGQPMGSNPYGQPMGANPFGNGAPRPPPQPARPTNPFDSGFTGGVAFNRQSSAPNEEPLTPVSLNPSGVAKADAAAKPDAFSDLMVPGLTQQRPDPKRQQVSGKELFKPVDKPKASLRELANQSPRP